MDVARLADARASERPPTLERRGRSAYRPSGSGVRGRRRRSGRRSSRGRRLRAGRSRAEARDVTGSIELAVEARPCDRPSAGGGGSRWLRNRPRRGNPSRRPGVAHGGDRRGLDGRNARPRGRASERNRGAATAPRIPRIAIITTASTRVKPAAATKGSAGGRSDSGHGVRTGREAIAQGIVTVSEPVAQCRSRNGDRKRRCRRIDRSSVPWTDASQSAGPRRRRDRRSPSSADPTRGRRTLSAVAVAVAARRDRVLGPARVVDANVTATLDGDRS